MFMLLVKSYLTIEKSAVLNVEYVRKFKSGDRERRNLQIQRRLSSGFVNYVFL